MIGMPSRIGYASLAAREISSCFSASYSSGHLVSGQTRISRSFGSTEAAGGVDIECLLQFNHILSPPPLAGEGGEGACGSRLAQALTLTPSAFASLGSPPRAGEKKVIAVASRPKSCSWRALSR